MVLVEELEMAVAPSAAWDFVEGVAIGITIAGAIFC